MIGPLWRRTLIAYSFMLPALILLGVFTMYPIIYGAALAFFDYDMLRMAQDGSLVPPRFVGLENFARLFKDPYLPIALQNSLLYLIVVPILQLAAILMAIAVNQPLRGIKFFRAAYYIPVVTSIVVIGIAWKWVFQSDGLLNQVVVNWLHLSDRPIGWLNDKRLALWCVMFVTLWQGLGYYMVLYLAGLQSIPPEYEEAARIDGASPYQVFTRVTLPLLAPTVAMCSIISCIAAIRVFGEIYVMTGGGPENATLTMGWYIWTKAFETFDMGYAAALALVLALFVGLVSLVNILYFKEGGLKYWQ